MPLVAGQGFPFNIFLVGVGYRVVVEDYFDFGNTALGAGGLEGIGELAEAGGLDLTVAEFLQEFLCRRVFTVSAAALMRSLRYSFSELGGGLSAFCEALICKFKLHFGFPVVMGMFPQWSLVPMASKLAETSLWVLRQISRWCKERHERWTRQGMACGDTESRQGAWPV